jgi:hypothetical protein
VITNLKEREIRRWKHSPLNTRRGFNFVGISSFIVVWHWSNIEAFPNDWFSFCFRRRFKLKLCFCSQTIRQRDVILYMWFDRSFFFYFYFIFVDCFLQLKFRVNDPNKRISVKCCDRKELPVVWLFGDERSNDSVNLSFSVIGLEKRSKKEMGKTSSLLLSSPLIQLKQRVAATETYIQYLSAHTIRLSLEMFCFLSVMSFSG